MANLKSPVTEIKGFGPKKAEAFARLGIFCIEDFLKFFPRDYLDLRNVKNISELVNDEKAVIEAVVTQSRLGRGYGRKRTLHLIAKDRTGNIDILFFMAGFMAKNFEIGECYRFYGKVSVENSRYTMFHPSYSIANNGENTGIEPVYPLTRGITQKDVKKGVKEALKLIGDLQETLPKAIITKANLCPIDYAISNAHFPGDGEMYKASRFRLIFEELFDLRIALKLSKDRFGSGRKGISFKNGSYDRFINSLTYDLTNAQKKALNEIESDMNSDVAMNRLLQGDVGSGKTVIAEAAIYKAVDAGYQAAFMAPTEILAKQHFETFNETGLKTILLTGTLTGTKRKEALEKIRTKEVDVIIGTHALISQDVVYNNLGLVITDEQHRFGVNQRKKFGEKGLNPDVLVMTATPIPRTLAVVLYSDLEVSIIDELPKGRKEIITKKFNKNSRKDAYNFLIDEVRNGSQAYIVAPFIEDSDEIDGFSAEGLFEDFKKKNKDISVALLHSEIKNDEKEQIMTDFSNGKISVLISTVVIEVGINVPNATVMLIENSERFGLAQMHQLRGRVGRGNKQSYCLIVTGEETEIAKERVEVLCQTNDGFVIAEKDLEIRGPGELFGMRQHGLAQLKLADPTKHVRILEIASNLADELLKIDPNLENTENQRLKNAILSSYSSEISHVL